jgi:hypothetical protein
MWNKKFFSIKNCEIDDVDVTMALKIIESEGDKKKNWKRGGKK